MLYSVSPRRKLNTVGLNPSWNFSTLMPMRLAARKCPSSCTKTSTPSTNANDRTVINEPATETSDLQLYPASDIVRVPSSPRVDDPDLRQSAHLCRLVRVHRPLDHLRYCRERQCSIQETGHGHFVGCVQHDG